MSDQRYLPQVLFPVLYMEKRIPANGQEFGALHPVFSSAASSVSQQDLHPSCGKLTACPSHSDRSKPEHHLCIYHLHHRQANLPGYLSGSGPLQGRCKAAVAPVWEAG